MLFSEARVLLVGSGLGIEMSGSVQYAVEEVSGD